MRVEDGGKLSEALDKAAGGYRNHEVEHGRAVGLVAAPTVSTIYYLLANIFGSEKACQIVRRILALFSVATADERIIRLASDATVKKEAADFEDSAGDPEGFKGSPILAWRRKKSFV